MKYLTSPNSPIFAALNEWKQGKYHFHSIRWYIHILCSGSGCFAISPHRNSGHLLFDRPGRRLVVGGVSAAHARHENWADLLPAFPLVTVLPPFLA
jgi:hypothetical protein